MTFSSFSSCCLFISAITMYLRAHNDVKMHQTYVFGIENCDKARGEIFFRTQKVLYVNFTDIKTVIMGNTMCCSSSPHKHQTTELQFCCLLLLVSF